MHRHLLISLISFTLATATPICPDERYFYQSDLNLCILNSNYFHDWTWAFLYCQRQGGNLPSIHNAFQNSLMAQIQYNLTGKTQSWLGAERLPAEEWSWIDQTPFDYQRFQTISSRGDGALLDSTDQYWKYTDSWNYNSFVCVAPPLTPTTTTRDPSVTTPEGFFCYPAHEQPLFNCKDGWQYSPKLGYEYLAFYNSTFDDGEAYCVSQGAHMVSIHSEAENDFVADLCCLSSDHYFYGGYYITGGLQLNGTLQWIDESPYDYQHEWCANPWDHENEAAIYIVNTESRGPTECQPKTWELDYNFRTDKDATPYYVCKRKRNN